MALADLSTENCILVISGAGVLSDWGTTEPPFVIEHIDPRAVLSRGLGGNANRFHRKNPGLRVTVNLLAGSPQGLALQAAANARQEMSGSYVNINGLEGAIFAEGVIVQDKSMGRGGMQASDLTFVMEFNTEDIQ